MFQVMNRRGRGGLVALAASLALAVLLAACGSGGGCVPGRRGPLPPPAPEKPKPPPRVVSVTLTESAIRMPATLPPGPTVLEITNSGELTHYLEINRRDPDLTFGLYVLPGRTGKLTLDLSPGQYRVWRPFDEGAPQGASLELTVTGPED